MEDPRNITACMPSLAFHRKNKPSAYGDQRERSIAEQGGLSGHRRMPEDQRPIGDTPCLSPCRYAKG